MQYLQFQVLHHITAIYYVRLLKFLVCKPFNIHGTEYVENARYIFERGCNDKILDFPVANNRLCSLLSQTLHTCLYVRILLRRFTVNNLQLRYI